MRYVRQRRVLELETAVEKERRRIARDIHDDLGARLAQVMLLSQVDDDRNDTGERRSPLPRIYEAARDVTKALDELVWAVNPSHDTLEGFAGYVARIAQEMITGAGIRCRLRIPDAVPHHPLGSGARNHLLMCMKEAVANAIKHAGCKQIEVSMEIDQNRLLLVVSDDGCGFDVSACASRDEDDPVHSGCLNMRARMRELGGDLKIVSTVERGTQVSFEYPL